MADTLEPFQKPVRSQDRYLLAGLAILIVALGGYVGWQHRTTGRNNRGAGICAFAGNPGVDGDRGATRRADLPYRARYGAGVQYGYDQTRVDGELVKVAFTEARTSGRAISWRRSIRDRFRPHTIKQ